MYLSQKDITLIFGAVGRVWPRTERYKHILALSREPDNGPGNGKWWYPCAECQEKFRLSKVDLDHIDPVVPTNQRQKDMTLFEYIERKFLCPINNFQILCKPCHNAKTTQERSTRTEQIANRGRIN